LASGKTEARINYYDRRMTQMSCMICGEQKPFAVWHIDNVDKQQHGVCRDCVEAARGELELMLRIEALEHLLSRVLLEAPVFEDATLAADIKDSISHRVIGDVKEGQ
jgi:hypothetical protein